jgi:hypothetical protein
MLPVGWLVFAVLAAVLLTMWVTFTLTRMDRLHARVDAAQAALDAQLVRRAAALQRVAESDDSDLSAQLNARYEQIALDALAALDGQRQASENAVGRALRDLAEQSYQLPAQAAAELSEAASRVLIARRFYNDAVRDTRTLRSGLMPRLFRLAGRRGMPAFFDIDDTIPVFVETTTSAPADSVSPDPAKDSA